MKALYFKRCMEETKFEEQKNKINERNQGIIGKEARKVS